MLPAKNYHNENTPQPRPPIRIHWFVVAHRAGARIFEQHGVIPELTMIHKFENAKGILKESELVDDRQGRTDFRGVSGHTAVGGDYSARNNNLEEFAVEIDKALENGALLNIYTSIILVAEPHFLGILKKHLGDATSRRMLDTVAKDLVHISNDEMAKALRAFLSVHEPVRPKAMRG